MTWIRGAGQLRRLLARFSALNRPCAKRRTCSTDRLSQGIVREWTGMPGGMGILRRGLESSKGGGLHGLSRASPCSSPAPPPPPAPSRWLKLTGRFTGTTSPSDDLLFPPLRGPHASRTVLCPLSHHPFLHPPRWRRTVVQGKLSVANKRNMPEKETSTASTAREEPLLMWPWWVASSEVRVVVTMLGRGVGWVEVGLTTGIVARWTAWSVRPGRAWARGPEVLNPENHSPPGRDHLVGR